MALVISDAVVCAGEVLSLHNLQQQPTCRLYRQLRFLSCTLLLDRSPCRSFDQCSQLPLRLGALPRFISVEVR